eukprot:2604472-Lingulodinium_polyedra.AAC.1
MLETSASCPRPCLARVVPEALRDLLRHSGLERSATVGETEGGGLRQPVRERLRPNLHAFKLG